MLPVIQISLPSYGLFAFIGAVISLFLLFKRSDKLCLLFTDFLKIVIVCIIGIIIGSKLLFAITRIPWLIENFTIVNLIMLFPASGFVYYGGLLGMLAAIWFIYRKAPDKLPDIYNMTAPIIPLFHGFGRIGCFLAGCCYGIELDLPLHLFGDISLTRIPVQLIEALFEFILFAVIITIEKKKSSTNLLICYLIPYAIFRFIIEFFRGDMIRGLFFGLSTSQWISIAILTVLIISLVVKNAKTKHIADV